ncbi:inositol polyphosphate-5-phosphatase A isoform X4 [Phyllopteryx taeniolatus]|uniref:inositol polyphosphate-5-phosphatase A isoform X4 n=1 Tax=Phyllopteryx taeniolatus TaxID=161469 RepID=UPI002AD3E065|nr:inositol polyphosphate-5-phosphatase A isoform X4 [Phyllopteryx taeniolatus]
MATRTDVLLVTANVGSLFDNVGEIQNEWLQELYKTIRTCQPQFIALHFQEVGGKEYMVNMGQAEEFFWNIESSDELKDFDRRCIYVDNQFQAEERFTALGSMYFIHKSLKNIRQYDFSVKDFKAVPGLDKFVGSLDGVTTMEKEKFPKNFWPDFKWSRKGFMRTRWIIHDRGLDLVNVHLFHDASNLIACKTSPSVYSANRKNALRHVINRISDNCHNTTPFFLFGDFNFRLDTLSLVQHLSTSAEVQTVKKDSSNEVQKIICEEKADRQVILLIEDKLFAYLHQAVFRDDNGKALLKYDKEVTAFHDVVREEEITFPPSYPYSEEYTKPTQYMNTRCPAWCDRILMSHAAQQFIHSPVFLFFPLKTNVH